MISQNFYKLLSLIKTHPIFNTNSNKQQADVFLQLAVFLCRLASKGDIFTICALFGIAEGFRDIGDFQNVVSVINGTHIILINKPPKDSE
ncbi:11573_t:CDS:2, partial [Funneliformis geosporum]